MLCSWDVQECGGGHGHESSRAPQGEGKTGLLQRHQEEEEEEDSDGKKIMWGKKVYVIMCNFRKLCV